MKPKAPEMGPDGPITPLVEEFGTPRSDGSPSQVCIRGCSLYKAITINEEHGPVVFRVCRVVLTVLGALKVGGGY